MIFYDKKTAREFREKAENEMVLFIASIASEINKSNLDLTENTILEYAKSKVGYDLPKIIEVLLYRSGLIFPDDGHGVYPVNLYYDDMEEYPDKRTIQFNSLNGGISKNNYSIHT